MAGSILSCNYCGNRVTQQSHCPHCGAPLPAVASPPVFRQTTQPQPKPQALPFHTLYNIWVILALSIQLITTPLSAGINFRSLSALSPFISLAGMILGIFFAFQDQKLLNDPRMKKAFAFLAFFPFVYAIVRALTLKEGWPLIALPIVATFVGSILSSLFAVVY